MNFRKLLITGCVSLMMSSAVMAAGEYVGERNAFNRFHGKGIYTYSNGNVYDGDWIDGRKSGQGSQTWENGDKYTGGWSNNREDGQGSKTWGETGDSYTGEWLQGKMSGTGTYKWANGDTYTGNFVEDIKQGKGVFVQASSGIKFEGTWKDDKRDGEFTVTMKNGTISRGVWKADKPPVKASVVMAGGELYNGPVRGGYLPHGKGTCTLEGKASACEFQAGKQVEVAVVKPTPKPAPKPVAKPAPKVVKAEPKVIPFAAVAGGAEVAAAAPKPPAKPKDPRTHRGERPDGTQFFFQHSWGGNSSDIPQLKVEKNINEFGAMKITASGGEFDVTITVDEYVGPGSYELKYFKASIQKAGESTVYRTSSSEPGKLVVLQDSKGVLIGTFSFTGYPFGNVGNDKRSVTEGEFAIPTK